MGMFGRMTFVKNVRCKHCQQKSPLRSGNWEALGKSQGWFVIACRQCGHGIRIGVFSERHISKGVRGRHAKGERKISERDE